LPDQQAAEVLYFAERLKAKQAKERRQQLDEFFKAVSNRPRQL
jgi:hypothetical protein